jgi:hypothetical protein
LNVANEEHVKILKKGAEVWNVWRHANPVLRPDLREAIVIGADLCEADLSGADLRFANLRDADLSKTNLIGANLRGAILIEANLREAHLSDAVLFEANLIRAYLHGANLTEARLYYTVFANVDLTSVVGLDTCNHHGPSSIDHHALRSRPLPRAFLRGVGLPDIFINNLPSLLNQPIQYYSCFISYSAKETASDREFAARLHADLESKGVQCWFAPHDLPIGKDILTGIDAAIRLQGKVLLILSEHSIQSRWVKDEVNIGFEEERKRGQDVLFPVCLDNAVMTTNEAWAAKLRLRNIGDFRRWRDHEDYKQRFERVVRDLTKEQPAVPSPP